MDSASSMSAFVPVWLDWSVSFFFSIGLRDTLHNMSVATLVMNEKMAAALTGSFQSQLPLFGPQIEYNHRLHCPINQLVFMSCLNCQAYS